MTTLPPPTTPTPPARSPWVERVGQSWPALVQRLGERRDAFEAAVAQRAAGHGLTAPDEVARYLNLCMAFGHGFEDKTENEWALAILSDERLRPAVKLHQLLHRAPRELQRRPADAATLSAVDQSLLDMVDAGRLRVQPDAARMPRAACDIEAVELRVRDTAWRQEYQLRDGSWSHVAVEAPAPLRIGAGHPAPEGVHLITGAAGGSSTVRLQVRQVAHGHCGLGLHPALVWLGPHGRSLWLDHEARSVAWPLSARVPAADQGLRLLAEPSPDLTLLELPSCALRDEGVPLGEQKLQLWAWPATQWLLALERQAPLGYEMPKARSAPPAAAPTRLRVECDAAPHDATAWIGAFDEGLRAALGEGLKRLLQAWQPHVQEATLRAEFGLLDGRAAITWGLRDGPRGMASAPLLRAVASLDLSARAELHLNGQVEYAGAKARLHLRVEGQAQLQQHLERLLADVPLVQGLQGAVQRWRWPVQLDHDAVADDSACVFSEIGPATGAIQGSMGLRPSLTRGGAWEFFVQLTLEPVSARVVVHDPLLGRSESHMALLPTVNLLDWSQA
ncbi:MAG: hypothetical protein U1F56_23930 [Rubrivivax sp.]